MPQIGAHRNVEFHSREIIPHVEKKDIIAELAKKNIRAANEHPSLISSVFKSAVTWLKSWSIINALLPKELKNGPSLVDVDSINPINFSAIDFDIGEYAALEIDGNRFELVKIVKVGTDPLDQKKDIIFFDRDKGVESAPINKIFKLNLIDQTYLIDTNKAGKSIADSKVGATVMNQYDFKVGDKLVIQKTVSYTEELIGDKFVPKAINDNRLVDVLAVKDNRVLVFDGRKKLELPFADFHTLKKDQPADILKLGDTLQETYIDIKREKIGEIHVGDRVALKYTLFKDEGNLPFEQAPPQYSTPSKKQPQDQFIYNLVEVVAIYPELVVTNGISTLIVKDEDTYGFDEKAFRSNYKFIVNEPIPLSNVDDKEYFSDAFKVDELIAFKGDDNQFVIKKIIMMSPTMVQLNDMKWVSIAKVRKIKP